MRRSSLVAHVLAVLTLVGEALQLALTPASVGLLPWGLPILVFTNATLVVGWLIAVKRPGTPLGWLLLTSAFLFGLQGITLALGDALQPWALGPASWLLSFGGANSQYSWIVPIGLLFTQIPLRFPTGALPSSRWRWFSWFTIAVLGLSTGLVATSGRTVARGVPNPFYVDWGGTVTEVVAVLSMGLFVPAFTGSIASLFFRNRHADAVQRAQLRWMFWAAALVGGLLVLSWLEGAVFGDETTRGTAGAVSLGLQFIAGLGYSLIPLAILIAVLRYGLYSIDRIISRTAAYAIVTLIVVAVYGSIVVLVSVLLPKLPALGVALATLAAAAVFLPLLRVTRGWVDRRFNRAQYDAERVVAAFGERIRTGADPQRAGLDLVGAVQEALQPAALGLWMREDHAGR